MKYLLAVLMVGLLSACSLGATSPSEQPLESIGESASMDASASPQMSMDESSAAPSSPTGMACEDAWQAVSVDGVTSVDDLSTIANELNQTFEACESASDWVDGARGALPALDASELESWASAQCLLDDAISNTPVCQELTS